MIIHICDKCGITLGSGVKNEIGEILDKELCVSCGKELEKLMKIWIEGGHTADTGAENSCEGRSALEWHPQSEGFPPKKGVYMLTIRRNDSRARNLGTEQVQMYMAKFTGAPCWYKMGKEFGLIDELGGTVTAWAEMPEPYKG